MKSLSIRLNEDTKMDLPRLVSSRALIVANSGGGKSFCMRRVLEQSHGSVQQIVLDPEGEFSTLREGFGYVLVGKGGDVAASPETARILSHTLLETGVSAIIDLHDLSPKDRILLVRRFLDGMVDAPKELWHDCLVFLDEAHKFCPEKGHGEAESSDAVIDMASRGRKRGYCLIPATQRLAKLHKDVAAECNNKIIGRCVVDVDIKRAGEELGFAVKDRFELLRSLEPGEFYVFGPAISTEIRKIKIGPVQTTHPEPGSKKVMKAVKPTAEIRNALKKLMELPEAARREKQTLDSLTKENIALRAELNRKGREKSVLDPDAIDRAVKASTGKIHAEHRQSLLKIRDALLRETSALRSLMSQVTKRGEELANNLSGMAETVDGTANSTPLPFPSRPTVTPPSPVAKMFHSTYEKTEEEGNAQDAIVGGAVRMLKVLVSNYPIRLTKSQLGTMSKMKHSGGSFQRYFYTLKKRGLIEERDGLIQATEAGIAELGATPPPPQSSEETREMWRSNLQGGARRMFDVLVQNYPMPMPRATIGQLIEMSPEGGSFQRYLYTLKSNGLIEAVGSEWKASDILFHS